MIKLFLVSKRRAKIIEILKINLLICLKNTKYTSNYSKNIQIICNFKFIQAYT